MRGGNDNRHEVELQAHVSQWSERAFILEFFCSLRQFWSFPYWVSYGGHAVEEREEDLQTENLPAQGTDFRLTRWRCWMCKQPEAQTSVSKKLLQKTSWVLSLELLPTLVRQEKPCL
jgi:hypothetical protein